jgi:hypothetical protein
MSAKEKFKSLHLPSAPGPIAADANRRPHRSSATEIAVGAYVDEDARSEVSDGTRCQSVGGEAGWGLAVSLGFWLLCLMHTGAVAAPTGLL